MNDVIELMDELSRRKIRLWVEGRDLRYAAPAGSFDQELRARVRTHREGLLTRLRSDGAQPDAPTQLPRPLGPMPLSSSQRRLWFLERLSPGAYCCPAVVPMGPEMDAERVAAALSELVERHEVLRTVYPLVGDEPRQVALEPTPVPLTALVVEDVPEFIARAQSLADEFFQRPFDLTNGPVIRGATLQLPDGTGYLLVAMHHIATDGWSMGLIAQELRALFVGERPREVSFQYADYAHWHATLLDSGLRARELAYWKDALAGAPSELDLPTDWPRPSVFPTRGGSYGTVLRASESRIGEAARRLGATPYMLLLAAFQALLQRYTGAEDVCIGTPVANRTRSEFAQTVGCFVNTVVVRGRPAAHETFAELVRETRRMAIAAFEHQALPFEVLVEALNVPRDTSRHPLFQVMFGVQTAPGAREVCSVAAAGSLRAPAVGAKCDLNVSLSAIDGSYHVDCEYAAGLFRGETVARLLQNFDDLLMDALDRPQTPIGELEWLGAEELAWLRSVERGPLSPLPDADTLHARIQRQMLATPDAVAVRFRDETVDYAALRARVEVLAAHLSRAGVRAGHVCCLMLDRCVDLVASILAVQGLGAAYLPIDKDLPPARVRFMLKDAGAPVVITARVHAAVLGDLPMTLVVVDEIPHEVPATPAVGARTAECTAGPSPLDLSYVIYTSGTTGNPKGVANHHAGLLNRVTWMQRRHAIGRGDVVLQKTSYAFDVSVWEFLWPLAHGATLCLAEPGRHGDPAYLQELIARERVSVLHFVPSMLASFLPFAVPEKLDSLRAVFVSGEALPFDAVASFDALGLGAKLYNLYGPTEASIDVTHWDCSEAPERPELVPIGRPIDNVEVRVLDESGSRLPAGVFGELCITGIGLATGYLGRPALTADRYQPVADGNGARLYRTGDRVRWLRDGTLEYAGRIDTQVKLRGFRIELGEIEARLKDDPAVSQAVALVIDAPNGDRHLVAYVVGNPGSPGAAPERAMRDRLRAVLPEYMVPHRVLWIDSLPTTQSGKADRKTLARRPIEWSRQANAVAPERETERLVASVWSEVLGVANASVDEKFFDLGGTSLRMVAVQRLLTERLGREITLVTLFAYPTIRSLARHVDGNAVEDDAPARDLSAASAGTARLSKLRRARADVGRGE